MKGTRKGTRGFTIPELMVAMGIMATLCALAIPNLLRGRMNAAETVVIGSCQTIGKGCQNFYARALPHTFPDSLNTLATEVPSYIDSHLGAGVKQGYQFTYTRVDADHYTLDARPLNPGVSGSRFFFLDQSGVLRVRHGAPAGPNDVPVE